MSIQIAKNWTRYAMSLGTVLVLTGFLGTRVDHEMVDSGIARGSISWDGGAPRLRVTPENVLAAAAALVDEAAQLRAQLAARLEALHLEQSGGDPTNLLAARAMTTALLHAPGSVVTRCLDHADALDRLADQLAEAARNYGRTEQEIAAAFAKHEEGMDRESLLRRETVDRPGGALHPPQAV